MSPLTPLLLSLAARAGTVVIHAPGDPDAAVARAAGDTETAAELLQPVDLPALLTENAPLTVSGGALVACATEATRWGDLGGAVKQAEGDLAYAEYPEALISLAPAVAGVACLQTPAGSAEIARVFYLQGMAHLGAGDTEAASAAYSQALLFQPTLAWDDDFEPSGRDVFDAARKTLSEQSRASLTIAPLAPPVRLWIDAQPAIASPVTLPPGRHHVQLARAADGPRETFWLTLDASADATLLAPAALPVNLTVWVDDPIRRAELALLLSAVLEPDVAALIPTDQITWELTAPDRTWQERTAAPTCTLPCAAKWTGAALAAGTGVWAAIAFGQAAAAAAVVNEATTGAAQQAALVDFEAADQRWIRARTAATAGVVVFGAAFTWDRLTPSQVSLTRAGIGPVWIGLD